MGYLSGCKDGRDGQGRFFHRAGQGKAKNLRVRVGRGRGLKLGGGAYTAYNS